MSNNFGLGLIALKVSCLRARFTGRRRDCGKELNIHEKENKGKRRDREKGNKGETKGKVNGGGGFQLKVGITANRREILIGWNKFKQRSR